MSLESPLIVNTPTHRTLESFACYLVGLLRVQSYVCDRVREPNVNMWEGRVGDARADGMRLFSMSLSLCSVNEETLLVKSHFAISDYILTKAR